jgi:pimeloyl-ACP methyl ester carboxylesterase
MQSTEKYVQIPDGQLYTRAMGSPVHGTILLAMGATASMVWWPIDLVEALARAGYRVIWFDQRDTGRSIFSPPGQPAYDVPDLAEDLIAILDAYEVPAAHLVGMSLGGLVAQIVALTHPDRVETITLFAAEPLGSAYDGEGMPLEIMDHFTGIATIDWESREAVTTFLLRIAELSAAPARPFDREAALDRIGRELDHTPSIRIAFNHALLAGEADPELKAQNIRQPTLVIHGAADPLIAVAAAKKTHDLIGNARLLILDDVGHEFSPAEVPVLSQSIIAFIGNTNTAAPLVS